MNITFQEIFDHSVKYFYNRCQDQKWVHMWGSGSDPNLRCALGSMDKEIYNGGYLSKYWKQKYKFDPFDHIITKAIMAFNDNLACDSDRMNISWQYVYGELRKMAYKYGLKYNRPELSIVERSEGVYDLEAV